MSTIVLGIFVVGSLTLWFSLFGYLVFLILLAPRRYRKGGRQTRVRLPEIAIVVPTLDEEDLIVRKLNDVRETSYPRDRIKITVVDGGSRDRTRSLVREEIERDPSIRLLCLAGGGQADQVDYALGVVPQEIVIVTDADASLDRDCVRELVTALLDDPDTALVGAQIQPATALLDENLHWRLVNYIWWLEGEVLSAGAVSGVCYAVRRSALEKLTAEIGAKDILVSLRLCAAGFKVRSCPFARATELRAPQSLEEFMLFRRRRGAAYTAALEWSFEHYKWRVRGLPNLIRWWHFMVTPKLTLGVVMLGLFPLWPTHWYWPLVIGGLFVCSLLGGLFLVWMPPGERQSPWRLVFASCRFLSLNLFSMLTLGPNPSGRRMEERE